MMEKLFRIKNMTNGVVSIKMKCGGRKLINANSVVEFPCKAIDLDFVNRLVENRTVRVMAMPIKIRKAETEVMTVKSEKKSKKRNKK